MNTPERVPARMGFVHGVQLALMISALLGGLVACDKPEGEAERAGKKIDQAADHAGQDINKAADKVGKKLEQAGEDLRDAAKANPPPPPAKQP